MLKWMALIAATAISIGVWVVYQNIASELAGLTPEAARALNAKVTAEREANVPKPAPVPPRQQSPNPLNDLYFGDLHVHTSWSFDGYLNGNRFSPAEAYEFARGRPLTMLSGEVVKISVPLDFAAVTDHAESYGLFEACADPAATSEQREFCDQFESPSVTTFLRLRRHATSRPPKRMDFCGEKGEFCIRHARTTWQKTQAAADDAYEPGVFTTFYGYEYSPSWPNSGSTHRNVIFRSTVVPRDVISAFDAPTALDLWRGLEASCTEPCEFMTIPHNLNRYYGKAFALVDEDGGAYAEDDWLRRQRAEQLVELFQAKGASECAVGVGTTDEECGFEQFFPRCEGGETQGCAGSGSFARDGLKFGLRLAEQLGFNPLRFGFVGSTDAHNANPGDAEEWDYRGKSGFKDASAAGRLEERRFGPSVPITHNPGGLAAVWAAENTRDALFDALRRRETYATSGTRLRLRVFAGWDLPTEIAESADLVAMGYERGVPMGGVLAAGTGAQRPRFVVWAGMDPMSSGLDRIQLIKGWVEDGQVKEKVADIACSDGRAPNREGSCPPLTSTLDVSTCRIPTEDGDAELLASWEDEFYRPEHAAVYYVRVLQTPTCRWSSYDAIRLEIPPVEEVTALVQERAWSSPIWIEPAI